MLNWEIDDQQHESGGRPVLRVWTYDAPSTCYRIAATPRGRVILTDSDSFGKKNYLTWWDTFDDAEREVLRRLLPCRCDEHGSLCFIQHNLATGFSV